MRWSTKLVNVQDYVSISVSFHPWFVFCFLSVHLSLSAKTLVIVTHKHVLTISTTMLPLGSRPSRLGTSSLTVNKGQLLLLSAPSCRYRNFQGRESQSNRFIIFYENMARDLTRPYPPPWGTCTVFEYSGANWLLIPCLCRPRPRNMNMDCSLKCLQSHREERRGHTTNVTQ